VNSIAVIVATFGDQAKWGRIADRALGSVAAQTERPAEIFHIHGETLAQARNAGALQSGSEWLLFLDADDAFDQHYVAAMANAAAELEEGEYLLQPATSAWYADGTTDETPTIIPRRRQDARTVDSLRFGGNWMVIGTMVRRSLFVEAGCFWEEPCMEDYSLFLRCAALGADCRPVPEAIYLVFQTDGGRNQTSTGQVFRSIRERFEKWEAERGLG
jgi:glycosyltransferase involved in cell wall biosynthesis